MKSFSQKVSCFATILSSDSLTLLSVNSSWSVKDVDPWIELSVELALDCIRGFLTKAQVHVFSLSLQLLDSLKLNELFLIWLMLNNIFKETKLILIRHLHIEHFLSKVILPRILEHLDFILDCLLWQHAVTQFLYFHLNALHRVLVVSEDLMLLSIAKQKFGMTFTRTFLQVVREQI